MCSAGECGFGPLVIQIDTTFSIVRSITIPRPNVFGLTTILGEGDQPPVLIYTREEHSEDGNEDVDSAEAAIVQCIIEAENAADKLSAALQTLKDKNAISINVRQKKVLGGGFKGGRVDYNKNPDGTLKNGSPIDISFSRMDIIEFANDWGVTYNEVFAEILIHEILHPKLAPTDVNHGQPGNIIPGQGIYGETTIGNQTSDAYKDIFGEMPPGWKVEIGGYPPSAAPGCLATIFNSSANTDFYSGVNQTYNAIRTYPTYDLNYEGTSL